MAEQIKHTPGPWEIEAKERHEHPLYITDRDGQRVAKCDQIDPFSELTAGQIKANARLMTAGPDLLAALEQFVSECDSAPSADKAPEMARKAIAKAEGRPL